MALACSVSSLELDIIPMTTPSPCTKFIRLHNSIPSKLLPIILRSTNIQSGLIKLLSTIFLKYFSASSALLIAFKDNVISSKEHASSKTSAEQILELKKQNIRIEGNFLKVIDTSDNEELSNYVNECIEIDTETRKKRLEVTRKVQDQNKELIDWKNKNEKAQKDLQVALEEANKAKAAAEKAKNNAEEDLDLLVKKNQNELVNKIVSTSLIVILGVGAITSGLYFYTIVTGNENQIIESSWANMFSILLTNSFSIIGTIMGVKHMQSTNDTTKKKR